MIGRACAPFLILLTPFTVFLQYHGYDYADSGVPICLLALLVIALALGAVASISSRLELLIIAGLLTLLADLQFHPPKGVIGLALIFVGLAAPACGADRHRDDGNHAGVLHPAADGIGCGAR